MVHLVMTGAGRLLTDTGMGAVYAIAAKSDSAAGGGVAAFAKTVA